MCPCHSWSEAGASVDFGLILNQSGIIELIDAVQGQVEPLSQVMIEAQRAVWLEERRVKLHVSAKVCFIVLPVLDDTLVSLASDVEPLKQLMDCV